MYKINGKLEGNIQEAVNYLLDWKNADAGTIERTASPTVHRVCSFIKKQRFISSSERVSLLLHTENIGLQSIPDIIGFSLSSVTTARAFLFEVPKGTVTNIPLSTDSRRSDGI